MKTIKVMRTVMSGLLRFWALVSFTVMFSGSVSAAWEATFVDNFDGNTLNQSAWATGRENLVRRIHYYDKDAVNVRNGRLELGVLNRAESDRAYSTGVVSTQGIFKQRYGYFEIRARLPRGSGFWPSFWLMPENGRWSSEIDIAEFRGFLPDNVHYALHYGNRLRPEHELSASSGIDLSSGYNNFAVNWTPQRIDYLLNGQIMHSITDAAAIANADSEMFMILNLALSSQHSGWNPTVNADTDLTQGFSIDYVRVYRQATTGRYQTIPGPTQNVPNLLGAAYDNTAVSVDHVSAGSSPDIMRTAGRVNGSLNVTANKPSYSARMFVFLSRLSNFNVNTGRYQKSAPIEELSFNLNIPNVGGVQNVPYAFNTQIMDAGAYVVDVLIKDRSTQNKKSLAAMRVVQYVDSDQANTSAFLQGFFRSGSAVYRNGELTATLPLQLQEALLVPYLKLHYRLFDTNSGEEYFSRDVDFQHDSAGLQMLEPNFSVSLDTSRSVALSIEVRDAADRNLVARYAVAVTNTRLPAAGWEPFPNTPIPTPPTPTPPPTPPLGGSIPVLNWEPSFVDNFNGSELRADAWRPGWEHLPRRMNYRGEEALRVSNGVLNIDALNRAESDRAYTTGTITTQGIFKQQYGYFEMRARIPSGNSFWPAFWLMPESGKWTSEIDIAEFRGHLSSSVHGAFHYGNRLHNEHSGDTETGVNLSSSFNNYAIYWTPQRIDYLFNNRIVHSIVGAETVANANSEMFVVLDMALASQHATGWIPVATKETNLAQSFEVDYVRVYRQNEGGSYRGIPASDARVEDTRPVAYDHTALSIDRVWSNGEREGGADILREAERITGQIELTSHRNNYAGVVSVFLTRLSNFNNSNGRYDKSSALAAKNYAISLSVVGDTQVIDYAFDTNVTVPGVYSVDVLVKDPATNNKYLFGSHRVVQFVDSSNANSGAFVDGFIRSVSTEYGNGRLSIQTQLQLQQSMLVPYLRVIATVLDSAGRSVTETAQNFEHDAVGLITIPLAINVNLNDDEEYRVRVSIAAATGPLLDTVTVPVGQGGAPPPPTPPTVPPGENTLHGLVINGANVRLDATLFGLQESDQLLYNLKLFQGGTQVGKFTGIAGNGYSSGRVSVDLELEAAPSVGSYRAVVFLHRNTWADKILFSSVNVSVTGSSPPTEPPVPPSLPPASENTLHEVAFNDNAASLDMTLLDIGASDNLLYNVKFFAGGRLIEKVTGSAGNGFNAGRLSLTISGSTLSAAQRPDRVVVFIHRNTWDNRVLFDSINP